MPFSGGNLICFYAIDHYSLCEYVYPARDQRLQVRGSFYFNAYLRDSRYSTHHGDLFEVIRRIQGVFDLFKC